MPKKKELKKRIKKLDKAADEELERIEKHGGCAGFALRIKGIIENG